MADEQLSCGCLRNPSGLSHLQSTFGWRLVAPTINDLKNGKIELFAEAYSLSKFSWLKAKRTSALDSVTVSLFAKDCESLEYIKSKLKLS